MIEIDIHGYKYQVYPTDHSYTAVCEREALTRLKLRRNLGVWVNVIRSDDDQVRHELVRDPVTIAKLETAVNQLCSIRDTSQKPRPGRNGHGPAQKWDGNAPRVNRQHGMDRRTEV